MKEHFILTIGILIIVAIASNIIYAQEELRENRNAPATYDANLKSGDRAVAAFGSDFEVITIVSKTNGIYRAKLDDGTDNTYQFRANAVYPYFDVREFGDIANSNLDLISPYLECYAKNRSVDFERLKGDGFRPPYFGDLKDMQNELQNDQTKLAAIEASLKNLSARPDTFLAYDKNPVVWYEIAVNRAKYLPCALGERQAQDVKESPWLRAHRDGIKKVLGAVERYRAGSGDSMMSSSEYAFYAVSPKMRSDWLKEKNALNFTDAVDQMLKPLADALNEKLPTYFPNAEKYAVRNPAEEALLKKVLPNPAQNKIFKIGLAQTVWQTDKGTLGIPQARYKNGLIYRRDSQADHRYCYATYANVIQNYAGGGTYGASRSEIIREELAACPAGN